MSVTDERVFFPEKMSERVSKEILALYSDPRWLSKSCTALMWTAHLMALELTERRERERKFIESFETIRQDASCSAYIGTICDEALLPEPPDA